MSEGDVPLEEVVLLVVSLVDVIERLRPYAAHQGGCPHPLASCVCGLVEVLDRFDDLSGITAPP